MDGRRSVDATAGRCIFDHLDCSFRYRWVSFRLCIRCERIDHCLVPVRELLGIVRESAEVNRVGLVCFDRKLR